LTSVIAQGAPQNFADIGLRQFVAKLDLSWHLVAGELGSQESAQLGGGYFWLLFDYEKLADFAGMLVGDAD
jgi:hypothetical protein